MLYQRWLACASIYAGGEYICATITDRACDEKRTARVICYGATADSIVLRRFHHIVERRIPHPFFRMVCEQLCYSPLSNATYMTVATGGFSWTAHDWARIYATDCCFWPMVSFMGYRFVPVRSRFLYVSAASLVWNVWRSSNV